MAPSARWTKMEAPVEPANDEEGQTGAARLTDRIRCSMSWGNRGQPFSCRCHLL